MNKLSKSVTLIMVFALAVPTIALGLMVGFNMLGQTRHAKFASPSGARTMLIRDDCRFAGCLTFATLEYGDEGRKAKMACKPLARTDDRFIFAGKPKVEWDKAELMVS